MFGIIELAQMTGIDFILLTSLLSLVTGGLLGVAGTGFALRQGALKRLYGKPVLNDALRERAGLFGYGTFLTAAVPGSILLGAPVIGAMAASGVIIPLGYQYLRKGFPFDRSAND